MGQQTLEPETRAHGRASAAPPVIAAPPGDAELAAWREGLARSRARRAEAGGRQGLRRRRGPALLLAVAVGSLGYLAAGDGSAGPADSMPEPGPAPATRIAAEERSLAQPSPPATPSRGAIADARAYAQAREGLVSFAVIDTEGRLHSHLGNRRYVSASIVKSLLLAAELRRLQQAGLPLDGVTRDTLSAMISYSDNAAADTIYGRVGDAGLGAVASVARMRDFSVVGHWTAAQVTADDMARFFARLDKVMPEEQGEFAKGLLGSVVEEQSWGIPAAAEPRWEARFKGGWRSTELGQLVHQAAELRRNGRRLSLAVLTDAQPTQPYAVETVEGIARRLVARGRPPGAAGR